MMGVDDRSQALASFVGERENARAWAIMRMRPNLETGLWRRCGDRLERLHQRHCAQWIKTRLTTVPPLGPEPLNRLPLLAVVMCLTTIMYLAVALRNTLLFPMPGWQMTATRDKSFII